MKYLMGILLAVGLLAGPVLAAEKQFEENVNYQLIVPEPEQGKPGDPIEVNEFFMWSCPHCNRFEPYLQEWLKHKPDDVRFVRIPAMFGGSANMHAKVYYALQAIGELDRLNEAFFKEIHVKRNPLKTRDAVDTFLASKGVDMEKFRKAMKSFAVAAKTNRAAVLMRRYGIRGVPALVVDGRYKSGRGLTYKELAELADFLVERVRKERTD